MIPLALALACPGIAPARAQDFPAAGPVEWGRTALLWRAHLAYESSSNIIYSTEARAPIPDFEDDVAEAGFNLGLTRHGLGGTSWAVSYGLQLERPQEFDDLRALDHRMAVDLTLGRDEPQRWELGADLRYYDFYNFSPWSFVDGAVHAKSTTFAAGGYVLEISGRAGLRELPEGVTAPVDYSVLGARYVGGEAVLKRWMSRSVRLSAGYDLRLTRHEATSSTFLVDRSGLGSSEERSDGDHRLHAELMWVRGEELSLRGGYEFRTRVSNADYYEQRGHFFRGGAVYAASFGGIARAAVLFGVVDFHERRFDPRFLDTRKDFRAAVNVSYSRSVRPDLEITLSYDYLDNDSNDSDEFDLGTTLSYGDVTERSITVSLDYATSYGL